MSPQIIIHYCWFGGNPLPESAKKSIVSGRKFLSDYELKEWNESTSIRIVFLMQLMNSYGQ
jgi:mannosyltransferase OCH1-like enzyme